LSSWLIFFLVYNLFPQSLSMPPPQGFFFQYKNPIVSYFGKTKTFTLLLSLFK
jgi:hypothetical protein